VYYDAICGLDVLAEKIFTRSSIAGGAKSTARHSRNQSWLQRLKPTSKQLRYGRAEARPSEGN
jgi:hypothetical protein